MPEALISNTNPSVAFYQQNLALGHMEAKMVRLLNPELSFLTGPKCIKLNWNFQRGWGREAWLWKKKTFCGGSIDKLFSGTTQYSTVLGLNLWITRASHLAVSARSEWNSNV